MRHKHHSSFLTVLLIPWAVALGLPGVGQAADLAGVRQAQEMLTCTASEEERVLPSDFDGAMVLGGPQAIPETVANMTLAWNNIRSRRADPFAITVRTTHRYIQCAPQNEAELDQLEAMSDMGVYFYDHPFYHDIVERGDFYHDPRVPLDQPTYQYAAIPADYRLPKDIACEVLEDLYLPEQDDKAKDAEAVDALVAEAMEITGHAAEPVSAWFPSGKIRMWEFQTEQWVGVPAVEVRAKRGFNTSSDTTDADGDFQMSESHKYAVDYTIHWRTNSFRIRHNAAGQAVTNGPRLKSPWVPEIDDGISRYYAGVYLPAYHYYHQYIQNLRRPIPNMKIRAYDRVHEDGHAGLFHGSALSPYVDIYKDSPGNQYTDGMGEKFYGLVIHELAHAAHHEMVQHGNPVNFNGVDDRIVESWALGVEWVLTKMRYPHYNINAGKGSEQYDSKYVYTPIVRDLIDSANVGGFLNPIGLDLNLNSPGNEIDPGEYTNELWDKVEGYPVSDIEDAVRISEEWDEWRDNLESLGDNPYEIYLDELFHFWGVYAP